VKWLEHNVTYVARNIEMDLRYITWIDHDRGASFVPLVSIDNIYVPDGVFTRSSKRPAIHVHFDYICWKFAGRLLDHVYTIVDRVNIL